MGLEQGACPGAEQRLGATPENADAAKVDLYKASAPNASRARKVQRPRANGRCKLARFLLGGPTSTDASAVEGGLA